VRDHQRPAFHKALGVDPDWYGQEVFRKTSEISKQVFPLTLDIDHPRWMPGLKALQRANADLADAVEKKQPVRAFGARLRAAKAFVGLFLIPAVKNTPPVSTRLEPAY
jgi:magnesium-protoporphyrin IX monomethyl ester (oxidative) cyclase